MELLTVQSLRKSFGGIRAVDGVDLQIRRGELRAIIGPNGAGKTTLFNLITGRLHPDAGKIFFRGEEITGLSPSTIVRKGIGRSFQRTNVFPRLTVFENVQTAVLSHRRHTVNFFRPARTLRAVTEEVMEVLASVDLQERAHRLTHTLSHGDQRLVEMAIVLASHPDLLLLDEPTAGMSPEETHMTVRLIEKIAREKTVIFTEHDMDVVFSVATTITVMHQGRVIAEGSPQTISQHPEVQQAYLGEVG
jgi:branched-chain amino acid transport system ATP-binding protein